MYLLKVFFITIVAVALFSTIYGIIISHGTLSSMTTIVSIILISVYTFPIYNMIVFILLLFHKFNKFEIICESIIYTMIVCFEIIPYFPEICYLSALLMTVIMAIYLLIKKRYMKHENNKYAV